MATRTRRKNQVQRAPDASRSNRRPDFRGSRDWKLGTWNCRSLNFDGSDRILSNELRVRGLEVVALQEVCWKDHYLVVAKLRQRLSEVDKIRYRRPQRYNLERLKDHEVATQYARELEAALPDEGELAEAPLEAC